MEEWKTVGQAARGVAIHFAKEGNARCDKKIPLIVFDKGGKTVVDITCAKCKQYKAYKDIDTTKTKVQSKKETPEEVAEKIATAADRKNIGLVSHKKKQEKKKEVDVAEEKPKVEKEKPKETYDISLDEPDADFAANKEKNGYNIVHVPTATTMFNGICQEVIEDALLNLNTIALRWPDKHSAIPKDFITKCRKALESAFEACEIEVPKSLIEKVPENKGKRKKPKKVVKKKFKKGDKKIINKKKVVFDGKEWIPETVRTIIRRKKKEKVEESKSKKTIKRRVKEEKAERVLKRRVIKEKGPLGMNPNKPPSVIVKHFQKTIDFGDLVRILKKQFGFTDKKAKSKIRGVVRKLSRRMGIEVQITMGKKESTDTYKI